MVATRHTYNPSRNTAACLTLTELISLVGEEVFFEAGRTGGPCSALDQAVELGGPHLVADVVRQCEERAVNGDLARMGAQCIHFAVDEFLTIDCRSEIGIRNGKRRQIVRIHALERLHVTGCTNLAKPRSHARSRHRAPVDLGDVPCLSLIHISEPTRPY